MTWSITLKAKIEMPAASTATNKELLMSKNILEPEVRFAMGDKTIGCQSTVALFEPAAIPKRATA